MMERTPEECQPGFPAAWPPLGWLEARERLNDGVGRPFGWFPYAHRSIFIWRAAPIIAMKAPEPRGPGWPCESRHVMSVSEHEEDQRQ